MIITTACLPAVRQAFPGAPIILLAQANMAPLFAGDGVVDQFWSVPVAESIESLVEKFRECGAQAILHFHPDKDIESAAVAAGIPERTGFTQTDESSRLTRHTPYRKSEGERHEADYCLDLIRLLEPESLPAADAYRVAPEPAAAERLSAIALWLSSNRKKFILVNPTTARADLRWPPGHFVRVGRHLASPEYQLVLMGHPANDPVLHDVSAGWRQAGLPFKDVSGKLDLAELAFLLRESALYISRDTGASHLAAAMGCPQVAIMGRPEGEFSPTRWKPLGENVEVVATRAQRRFYETRRMFWRRSFRSIRPERVIEAARKLLG